MTYALEGIGKALQLERDRLGLTQRAFAKRAGTTQARVSTIENGDVDLRLSTLIEFARALDLDLMLIPRRHVPAVTAIIAEAPISQTEKTGRSALARLANVIVQLGEQFPGNRDLSSLQRSAGELGNFRLDASHAEMIDKITAALKRILATPALLNTADTQADALRRLRNALAHSISYEETSARPAYRLDEDDGG